MKRYWFKTYIQDVLSKERMQLPDWLFRRLIEFEALAADFGEDGLLPPVKDMAWTLRPVEETKLSEALLSLSEVGEVDQTPEGDWRLIHFHDKQKSEAYDRVKSFRDKRNAMKRDVTEETEDALLSSSSDSLSDSSSEGGGVGEGTNDSWIPETPKQAASHPDIMAYKRVCGGFPGERDYAKIIETIQFLRGKHGDKLEETLKPYWSAWSTRKTKDGKPYSPHSLVWLCEWAMQGEIPRTNGHEPKRTHNKDIIRKAAQHATR